MSSLLEQASLVITPNAVKEGKLYSIKPTSGAGDLDVVRATTATRVNSAGLIESVANNVPRLDYTNGSCPSILVEPQRTNLVLRSEEFDNASWVKTGCTITANTSTDPFGGTTADKMVSIASNTGVKRVEQTFSAVSGTTYTVSAYFKADGWNFAFFNAPEAQFTTRGDLLLNLTDGTLIGSTSLGSVENVGNGWYRLRYTRTATSSGSTSFRFGFSDTASTVSTGDGTNGVLVWGAQLEAGSNATSYIPSVASAVTRNADVISKTGISDLIGQTEGTLYWEGRIVEGIATDLFIIGNIANSVFFNITSTNQLRVGIRANSALIAGFFSSALSVTNFKIAIAYKSGDIVAYVNGVQVSTNSTTFTFNASVNEIEIGRQFFDPKATQFMTQALLFKTRLTNAELANLTTL